MSATIPTPATPPTLPLPARGLTAAICVVPIAACGSSGQKPSASSHAQSLLAVSERMRRHEIPNFPDPGAGGKLDPNGTGINPFSPSFEAAHATSGG
jgi:hypothetical protein